MRTNLPVSQVERPFREGESIVSKTDLKGRITYINPYFCEISGFAEDELLGKPHNLIRHPDMPEEAFADLWNTLRQARPWTGLVKNRCKNGDFYWVRANVTPVLEQGKVAGYMSVRTRAERAEVEAAERIYAQIRTGKARGLTVKEGAVVRTGWPGRLGALRETTLTSQITLAMGSLLALFLTSAALPELALELGLAGALLCLMIGYRLRCDVVQPLRRATRVIHALMGGDLRHQVKVEGHGEMGQMMRALAQLNISMASVMRDVQINVHAIRQEAASLASGNRELSARTESQAASLEQTAASMDEFASTVRENAANALLADQCAASASQVAARGGDSVTKVRTSMAQISEASRRIADIISVIDGIAFQTNILSLNAGVEAARAGESGRGFAVVASEVRTLAQRSSEAAREIRTLIAGSAEAVSRGVSLADETARTMDEIVGSVRRVTEIMNQISTASREQDLGIGQVNQAVAHMDEVTQHNAAMVEQAADATSHLAQQAVKLTQAVSVFELGQAAQAMQEAAVAAPRLEASLQAA